MVKHAIALDGTCTGEHGVGMGKREYLYEELGEGTVALMKTIKNAIDPLNLFNPGKVRSDVVRRVKARESADGATGESSIRTGRRHRRIDR